ncbi:hypothetical protein MPSEU_000923500 [Mayamaea pseudoterrestris]|nr:hypothetical protein MPSEU_000923500 [Mayamaea pseudoterrestris]
MEIANQTGIISALRKAKSVRPVLVMSVPELTTGRCKLLSDALDAYNRIFADGMQSGGFAPFRYVFTKCGPKDAKRLHLKLTKFFRERCGADAANEMLSSFVHDMIVKTTPCARCVDLEEGNYEDLLRSLWKGNLNCIDNPRLSIKDRKSKMAMEKLHLQLYDFLEQVSASLEERDFPRALELMALFDRLATAMPDINPFWIRATSAVTFAFDRCSNVLLSETRDVLGRFNDDFAHYVMQVKTTFDGLLLFAPLLDICGITAARNRLSTVIRLVSATLTDALLADTAKACSEGLEYVGLRQQLLFSSILRLKVLSLTFGGTALDEAVRAAMTRNIDMGVAWVTNTLTDIAAVISNNPYHFPIIVDNNAACIDLAANFSDFLAGERIVESRTHVFYHDVFSFIMTSLRKASERAESALSKFVSDCHGFADTKRCFEACETIDFEYLGCARAFLLSRLASSEETLKAPGVCFPNLSGWLELVQDFDTCTLLYLARITKLCGKKLGQIVESTADISMKKRESDVIGATLCCVRRGLQTIVKWKGFDDMEATCIQESLSLSISKHSLLDDALAEEAQNLVRGLQDATSAANSLLHRLKCGNEDAGKLLVELSEPEHWDLWCEVIKTQKSGVMSGFMNNARSLFGMNTARSELTNAQQALIRHFYGQINQALWIVQRLSATGNALSQLMSLLRGHDDVHPALCLLFAFVQLPKDSSLLKSLFTFKNRTAFEKHLCEALNAVTDCIRSLKDTPRKEVSERSFGNFGRILSAYKNAEKLHSTFASFCNVDVSFVLSDRYFHQLKALQLCLITWPKLEILQEDAALEVVQLEKEIHGLSFNEILACVNEDARETFYADIVAIMTAAQTVHELKEHMDEGSRVLDLYPLVVQKVEAEINAAGRELTCLCAKFPTNKANFSCIYALSGNLQSIEKALTRVQPTLARLSLSYREGTFQSAREALDCYISIGLSLPFNDMVNGLVLLKTASRDVPCWRLTIDRSIDQFIEMASSASENTTFLLDLSLALQKFDKDDDGHIGQQLLTDHKCFEGAVHAAFNDATAGQDISYVISGLSLSSKSSSRLRSMYEDFEELYVSIITAHLGSRFSSNANSQALTVRTDSLADLAQATMQLSKDNSLTYEAQVIALSSHTFAYWSLKSSNAFALTTTKTNFLMKPHPAQVVAILTLLNVIEEDQRALQNHLLELKTGEGKSVVLGVTATVLALLDYEVCCVCYSKYLSDRDIAAFRPLFQAFQVEDYISYGTIDKLMTDSIEGFCELARKAFTGTANGARELAPNDKTRPRVLLVDEVDVFFGPNSFGSERNLGLDLCNDSIVRLFQHVWQNSSNLTTASLLASQEVTNVLAGFPSIAHPLLKKVIKPLVASAKGLRDGIGADYVVSDGLLGYKMFDGLAFHYCSSFCSFAYIKECEIGNVTEATMNSMVNLCPAIARLSNAEIPFEYDAILGVTGTLSALSKEERCVLEDRYDIFKYSCIPSVFGENRLDFAPESATDVIICSQREDHFLELKHEIHRRRTMTRRGLEEVDRPVMVFFESKRALLDFYESSYMQVLKSKTRTITESAPLHERTTLFQKATTRGAITLMIRDFGRGTDFKCLDKTMLQAGGVHVIQAFFSSDASEETQIKGRCARQGADGSYSMVINAKQLTNDLGLSGDEIRGIINGEKRWKHLDQKRSAMATNEFKKRLEAVNEKEELHYRSHTCLETMLDGDRQKQAMLFFEELNGMKGTNRVFSSGVKNIKAKMLSERRKRLEKSFAGVRRKWQGDDSAKEEPLAAKIKASIQEKEMARIRLILADTEVCYFELLDVNTETPVGIIEESYRKLANLFDPDKNESEDAQTIFQALENARDVLLDDGKRVDYISRRDAQRED